MRALVLGGTGFIGRHVVEALLVAGHAVSSLARGSSPDALPAAVERLRGDRDAGAAGLSALAGRAWDACIDISGYTPRQVRPSVEWLHGRVRRYVYVSVVSVYGDPDRRPVRESQPRIAPAADDVTEITGETYGALKVACEDIVQRSFGERCTLLRPQIVVGPHDSTTRNLYWVQRALRGGEMLGPGDGSDHLQFIDVRDLARFVRTVIERDIGGAFNLAGPRLIWTEYLRILGARDLVWVPASILSAAGLGFLELPLYRPERDARASLMDVSNDLVRAAGLMISDPVDTLRDVRAWLENAQTVIALSPQREAELIALARSAAAP